MGQDEKTGALGLNVVRAMWLELARGERVERVDVGAVLAVALATELVAIVAIVAAGVCL